MNGATGLVRQKRPLTEMANFSFGNGHFFRYFPSPEEVSVTKNERSKKGSSILLILIDVY